MNLPPGLHLSRTNRSIGGVLSAVGSLLQALDGERGDHAPPADAIAESPAPMMPTARIMLPPSAVPRPRADAPHVAGFDAGNPADEVSALLADARARAQAIMDESTARAEELMRPAAEPAEQQTLERVRRSVADIATDVRALHQRLDVIEALVHGQSQRQPPGAPPAP